MQDNAQKRGIDVEPAVVLDETEFSEFVHEEIYARARCAHHFCQHLLRYLGKHLLRFVFLAVARQQQQRTRQPLLAGVKKLID